MPRRNQAHKGDVLYQKEIKIDRIFTNTFLANWDELKLETMLQLAFFTTFKELLERSY